MNYITTIQALPETHVAKTILIVDDVTFTRAMMARLVQSINASTIIEAESGQQALAAIQDNSDIDIIVADLLMPHSNGLELLKMVRTGKTAVARDIPFIVVSGAMTIPVHQALDALDVSAALDKPAQKTGLEKALGKVREMKVPGEISVRSIEDYETVSIAGLLDVGPLSKDQSPAPETSLEELVSFLEAAPILAGLDHDELEILATRARPAHYPTNTLINANDFSADQLPLISKGEAEILQTAELADGHMNEYRMVLLEAGNALGTFNFMSSPDEYELQKVRTTRATEVVTLDFEDSDPDSRLSKIRSKVKATIGKILAQRITYSDKALANSLSQQLVESKIKQTAGGYVIMMFVLLAVYTLGMRVLLEFTLDGWIRSISSVLMILVFLAPFAIILKTGSIKAADLGLTLRRARPAMLEAIVASSIFIAVLTGIKFLVVTLMPTFQGQALFGLSQDFTRLTSAGGIDWAFYGANVLVYALFVPAQEIIARCGIQSLLVEFLYGSDTRRAVTAIIVSNFVFAAAHTHLNVGIALSTFIGGLFLGWLFHRNRSIIGVSIAHFMIGGTALFILDLEGFFK